MHISEGVLKPEIIVPCSALCVVLVSSLIYKLKTSEIPKVAAVSAMFFMASFIHVPIGVTSIHLVLSGLAGAFLGANAVLAIFIALFFQALLFGYGGLSALGVNLLIIASPALLSPYLLKLSFKRYRSFFLVFDRVFAYTLLLGFALLDACFKWQRVCARGRACFYFKFSPHGA